MRKKTKKLAVQSLESRDLMAADLLSNGELLIETGNGNDNIEIHVETSYYIRSSEYTGKLGYVGRSSFVSIPLLTSGSRLHKSFRACDHRTGSIRCG